MNTPVVLSYFSQSKDLQGGYLEFLETEYRGIAKAWEQYQIQNNSEKYFEVEFPPRGIANGEDVAEDIRNYKHRIIVFHFSGHAGSEQLLFKDGTANAKGLAGLIGEAQNLKLVFLNGCATYDQVNLLFEKNVKVVIATKGKINDGIAKEFAETFYQALSTTQYTIRQAFEHAMNELKRQYAQLEEVSTKPIFWRGLDISSEDDRDRWELYVKEKDKAEIENLNWWKIRLINPQPKDILNGKSTQDQAFKWILLILLVLGICIIGFNAFVEKDIQFALFGLVPTLAAFFGYKSQQRYKTAEFNSGVVDRKIIQEIKLFS